MKSSMLNKSKSISSTESEMVHWLEGLYKDLEIIDTLPDSLDVKAEYIDCLDLTQAMSIVRKRKESIETLKQVEKKKPRSEEHTSELQSRFDIVCRLL